MSKIKSILLLALLWFAQISYANVITGVAAIPDGYYDGVSGKKGADNILNALNTCISKDYNEISYKGLEPHYLNTDFYSDTLWDMYSTCRFTYEDANVPQKKVCDGWNKEHVCCQSWLGSGPMVSDLFNVYPTDARINNLRSNYPYGVVSTFSGFSGDPDKHGLGKLGSSVAGVGTVYEPDDRYKGDFARTFFYMVARYRDKILNSGDGAKMFSSNPTNLTAYSLAFLLEWHRNDPVSEKEIDRNQAVYGEQNNRNPFIDYPDLVEYIWGTKKNQQVDLSTMTPTCDGGGQDPAGKVKYGVSWSVNGVILSVDSIVENKAIQTLSETPESCSSNSNVFVGWTDAPIDGIAGEAPAILYREPSDFPPVTADVTYYAVFAHAETIDQGKVESTESVNMKAQGFSNGQEVTSITKGDVTLTFGKGTAGSNVPKYYNTGEAVRCYPGNTMTVSAESITKIVFTFGSGDSSNAISVNTGTLSGSTWTGDADQVVFSVGGSSGHRRIAQVDVTMNGSGAQTVYSDFLTSCAATDIENHETPNTNHKLLIDGHLYIEVNGHIFNITGQRIK
ncbi:MAG: endonuclease [Paludibacteraceae bacterium]|nr:endonuclease [Paludibacteraceae bacterium]